MRKMSSEPFNRADVVVDRRLGVVAPLEFFQHHASEMGHKSLLVTHTLPDRPVVPHA